MGWSTTSNSLPWAALVVATVASGAVHGPSLQRFEAVEPHMGTLCRIELYAPDSASAQRGFHAAFQRIADLDRTLSDYDPKSELSRISSELAGMPVAVSTDLFTVLDASWRLASATGGAFDVTIGTLTHLWREARRQQHLPDPASIRIALESSGYRKLKLDPLHRTVEFTIPGVKLDVGGIAKGYAADQALQVLERSGIHNALVAASGDLAFSGPPPGQSGWRIGINRYDSQGAPVERVLQLSHGAVSTSGDTEQHLDEQGKRYSHVLNPHSGMALTRRMLVTVIAPRGIDADGISTAVSVLGEQEGLRFIESRPELAAVISTQENGKWRSVQSSRFPKFSEKK